MNHKKLTDQERRDSSNYLIEICKEANITYSQLSRLINVHSTYISQVITCYRSISVLCAQKICFLFQDHFNEKVDFNKLRPAFERGAYIDFLGKKITSLQYQICLILSESLVTDLYLTRMLNITKNILRKHLFKLFCLFNCSSKKNLSSFLKKSLT